jgi:hypothetical protein
MHKLGWKRTNSGNIKGRNGQSVKGFYRGPQPWELIVANRSRDGLDVHFE